MIRFNFLSIKQIFVVLFALCLFLPKEAEAVSLSANTTASITPVILMKSYKDLTKSPIVMGKFKRNAKSFSKDDKDVITKYVFGAVRGEDTFLYINAFLRENLNDYLSTSDITKPFKNRLKFYAEGLRKSIAHSQIPQNVILYKDVNEKDLNHFFKDKNIKNIINSSISDENAFELQKKLRGEKFVEKGFILSTYNKNTLPKSKFVFEIRTPQNMQAVLIEDFDTRAGKSVLINEGYKWEVVSVAKAYNNTLHNDYYNIVIKFAR